MDLMDFEAIDDVLIVIGVVAIFLGYLIPGVLMVVAGLLLMFAKGESASVPNPQNRKDYEKIDTGTDDDFGDDSGDDADGDDGDDGDD